MHKDIHAPMAQGLNRIGDGAEALADRLGLVRAWNALTAWPRAAIRSRRSLSLRTQRDIERVKLAQTTILAPDRAVTLLATGDRIFVDPRDRGCGAALMHHGRYEEDELRLFRAYLTPDATVLDVGANYGYYSLCAAPFVRPGGRVIAFEPNPHIRGLLNASLVLNAYERVVEVRETAASDTSDRLCFVVDETGPGGAHVENPAFPVPPNWIRLEVPVERLDDQLPGDLVVDLVKMDVEGHETRALAGMAQIIRRSPGIKIFMEFIYVFLGGEDAFERLFHLITVDLGLRVNRLLPDGRTVEVDRAALVGASCTLVLSRQPLVPVAEVTVEARHLELASGTSLSGRELAWRRAPGTPKRQTLCFGGNLYLPRGSYRMAVDGRFEGAFLLRLVSQGEILWEERVDGGAFSRRIALPVDAPRLEVVLIAVGFHAQAARLTSVAFWR